MTRLLTFIMVALLSLWIGMFWFDPGQLHFVVIYAAYPTVLAAFSIWLLSIFQLHRSEVNLRVLLPFKRSAWLAVGAASLLLILMEPMAFKIVYDEVVLAVIAEFIHFDRLSGMPRQGNDYTGAYTLLDAVLDKRPTFFPFLTALVHDLTGYRYQNAFYLNAGLTVLLTTLLYGINRLFSGHRAGLLSLALLSTLPLLGIYASSGHFEVLNLVMILLVVIFSYFYLLKPNEKRLIPLVYALILLAQVRYESSLYLLPFGVLILIGWRKAGKMLLPWQVLVAPMMLVVYALHLRLIQSSTEGFFQEGPNGRISTFSISYLVENLTSAFQFFFATTAKQSNSFLLSALGISSVFLFLAYSWKRAPRLSGQDARGTTLFFTLVGVGIFCCIVSVFNFGLFNEYITSRLSLPIHLLWVLLIPFVLKRYGRDFIKIALLLGVVAAAIAFTAFDRDKIIFSGAFFTVALIGFMGFMVWALKFAARPRQSFILLPVLWTLGISLPVSHSQQYSEIYVSNDMMHAELEFIDQRLGKERFMILSSSPYASLLKRVNTAHIGLVQSHPEIARDHLRDGTYDSIYVILRTNRNDDKTYSPFEPSDTLDPDVFVTEKVWEKKIKGQIIVAAYRILEVYPPERSEENVEETVADGMTSRTIENSASLTATAEPTF